MSNQIHKPNGFKILQLADILLESQRDPNQIIDSLVPHTGNDFDYVVISGNLTAHGKASEFRYAKQLIEELGKTILRQDVYDESARRILIVPGSLDGKATKGKRSFREFNKFYDEMFSKFDYAGQRLSEFWHKDGEIPQLSVRVLPDFVSVGFFWDRNHKNDQSSKLWEHIGEQHGRWHSRGPLVLLSSCVPPSMLREGDLSPTMCRYLVGKTPQAMLGEIRYSALRWKIEDLPIPCKRGNIHHFTKNGGVVEHRSQIFDYSGSPSTPVSRISLNRQSSKRKEIFIDVLEKLTGNIREEWEGITNRRIHLVRGVPGAGKSQFFDRIRKYDLLRHSQVANLSSSLPPCIIQAFEIWDDTNVLHFTDKLNYYTRLLSDRIARKPEAKHGILLIQDHSEKLISDFAPSNDVQVRTKLDILLGAYRGHSIIFIAKDEFGLSEKIKNLRSESVFSYWLPMGNDESFSNLLKENSTVAFEPEDLAILCGRMCGLGKRLLDALADSPDGFGSSRNERWKQLIKVCKESRSIKSLLADFVEFFHKSLQYKNYSFLSDLGEHFAESPIPEEIAPSFEKKIREQFLDLKGSWRHDPLSLESLESIPLLPYIVQHLEGHDERSQARQSIIS